MNIIVQKTVLGGLAAGSAILILLVMGTLLQADYISILKEYPDYNFFMMDISPDGKTDHLEFMSRAPNNIDARYLLWKFFQGGNIKFYYEKTDLVADVYFKVFDGTTQVVYKEEQQINYTPIYSVGYPDDVILCSEISVVENGDKIQCVDEKYAPIQRVDVTQRIDYFSDSRHTNFVGELLIKTNTYPTLGKVTIEWYPKDKEHKYIIRMESQTDELDRAEVYKLASSQSTATRVIDSKGMVIDWSDSLDKLSYARRYDNGKVIISYLSAPGDQVIDPLIGTTQAEKQSAGNGRIVLDDESYFDDYSINTSANYITELGSTFTIGSGTMDPTNTTAGPKAIIYAGRNFTDVTIETKISSYTGQTGLRFCTSEPCTAIGGPRFQVTTTDIVIRDSAVRCDFAVSDYRLTGLYLRAHISGDNVSGQISTDGVDWETFCNNASTRGLTGWTGAKRIGYYDYDSPTSFDYLYIREHNGESIDNILSMSFEQGAAVDESLYSNEVINTNTAFSYDTGLNSTVAVFNGINTNITILNTSVFETPAFTISLLVRLNKTGVWNPLWDMSNTAGNYYGHACEIIDATNILRCPVYNGTDGYIQLDGSSPLVANVWTYLTFSFDGSYSRIYYNGAIDAIGGPMQGGIGYGSNILDLTFGNNLSLTRKLNGSIDCVKYWGHNLSIQEINIHKSNCFSSHGLINVSQSTNLSAISTNGTTVEGWYVNGTKVGYSDSYIVNMSGPICANMTNEPDSVWSNCVYGLGAGTDYCNIIINTLLEGSNQVCPANLTVSNANYTINHANITVADEIQITNGYVWLTDGEIR